MFLTPFDLFTILIATAVNVLIGFLWYSPYILGNDWIKERGWTKGDFENSKKTTNMMAVYLKNALATTLTSLVLFLILQSINVYGLLNNLVYTLFLWIGFVVPQKYNEHLYGGASFKLFIIDIGYPLIALLAMTLVYTLLR